MDNFNKIVSFVLGLVVVIVFLAVITGRFNIRKSFQGLAIRARVTPTPTIANKPYSSPTPVAVILGKTNNKPPTTIPATGSPTILLSALFSTLSLGVYLKRKK